MLLPTSTYIVPCIMQLCYFFIVLICCKSLGIRTRETIQQYSRSCANYCRLFSPRGRSERRTFFAQRKRRFMHDHKMSKAPVGHIHTYVHTAALPGAFCARKMRLTNGEGETAGNAPITSLTLRDS